MAFTVEIIHFCLINADLQTLPLRQISDNMKMQELVDRFADQLDEALQIADAAVINKPVQAIRNVFVSGLGGSGIGGNFVAEIIRHECKLPYTVSKGYDIPRWVGKNTLAIASSYSGNTEETLAAFEAMVATGAKVVVIASGGKLIARAKELGLDYIQVPGGWPSPRACLGFSLVQQLCVLVKLKLISNKSLKQVAKASVTLRKNQASIQKEAAKIANKLHNGLPIIYTTDRMESVAVRFRQQVNENAKMLCWHHVIPEMNHNELVGWRENNPANAAVIYFRSKNDFARNATRVDINKQIIGKYTDNIMEVWSKGGSLVEEMLYHVYLGDYASCYLADLRGFDSIEVTAIDFLKGELGKV
jgi:glucose/mannose-6-phosphate isomerase